MFTGSGHVPYGLHDKFTEGVGGNNNGTTTNDLTQYYETVPSNYLEHALWLESDRMGWLLDALDTAKYNAQRDIVKNERRQGVDNQPYGRVERDHHGGDVSEHASVLVAGDRQHGRPSAASVDDVKAFFRLYYAPNNATLAITGDFDPAQTKAWIAKYFSGVPRGKPIVRPTVAADAHARGEATGVRGSRAGAAAVSLVADGRREQRRSVRARRARRRPHAVAHLAPDQGARVRQAVGGDRRQLPGHERVAGEFDVIVTPRPGHSLTELEADVDSMLATLRRDGPTADEIGARRRSLQLGFLAGLESNLGKAQRLAIGQAFHNDPNRAFAVDYAKYQAVTAADVKRVANKYLGTGRVVLSIVPDRQEGSGVEAGGEHTVTQNAQRLQGEQRGGQMITHIHLARAAHSARLPRPACSFRARRAQTRRTPRRSIARRSDGGQDARAARSDVDEADAGERRAARRVRAARAAARLDERQVRRRREPVRAGRQDGPRHDSSADAARRHDDAHRRSAPEAMQSLGSNVNASVRRRERQRSSLFVDEDKFEPMLAHVRGRARESVVPAAPRSSGCARARSSTCSRRRTARGSIAGVVFPKVLYTADQPYGRSTTEQSVKAITRDDLVAFHEAYFQPGRAVITVVGDVKPDDVKRALDKALAPWKAGRQQAGVRLSGAAGAEGDDDLSRRQAAARRSRRSRSAKSDRRAARRTTTRSA